MKCWGDDFFNHDVLTPTPVQELPPSVTAVSVGTYHARALASDDSVWCWGEGSDGALGYGEWTSSPKPVRVRASEN